MGNSVQVDELSEVLVYRDEDPVFSAGAFQNCPVAAVRAEGRSVQNVVPLVLQPLGQPTPDTSVRKESQPPDTETSASVSPAMTVWA